MKIVKFSVEGVFNSFRIPFFRTYHKSFLAPPKTTIIGFLTNIMGRSEQYYYKLLDEEKIKVSVVINSISGRVKDLWAYKSLESKSGMFGRSIIRRDKLFNASYTIYLMIEDNELRSTIINALKFPKSIPALGLDDELVKISHIEENIDLILNDSNVINSVFMDYDYKYKVKLNDTDKEVELPIANIVPLKYKIDIKDSKRLIRRNCDEARQVEYLNCKVQITGVKSYICNSDRVVFY